MVDTKTPDDKKLSVPSKTLSLKPRVETGTVRQSFSHGRSKQVVVEKRGKPPHRRQCRTTGSHGRREASAGRANSDARSVAPRAAA
ncbi:hypothetical protein ABIG07_002840 [Bradyrhizobium ottawaense]|uniref:Initiation factor 2 associated domain-containing protein n=1 Tax=Bradyrhizobium ottawaense TaxID=931866 RepID=A0ABV4FR93_9BRAD